MLVFLKVLLIIVSVALIAGVLLQSGKGGGLAGMDGGASALLGAQGKALDSVMSKITTVAAILFMVLSLIIAAVQ
ncbi:protein translocase subunit secG [Orenia metallireducens]|uniref:Protein-export membrane protein SecG n=1 Tax=Orenia metallireducens TaxID=1413210 RepID=A0A285H880_9FIRM|nr:preprotein translocase subunit SecG [Orenia metallireducens]PRX28650.1 protein translocase subunit secG [Orenia metallireducens]SNY31056.1 protein translocase subunit secG [Orenia metallireducens]